MGGGAFLVVLPEQELTWSVVGGGNLKIPKWLLVPEVPGEAALFLKWRAHWPPDTRVGSCRLATRLCGASQSLSSPAISFVICHGGVSYMFFKVVLSSVLGILRTLWTSVG